MRILGIDPGSITCGYGIIETRKKQVSSDIADCVYITSGSIKLSQKNLLHIRLKKLYDALVAIIREYKPQEIVVERIFFAKGVKTALSLGQARGVVLLTAASAGLNVFEYGALEVKKAITGYGKAEKRQVYDMVIRILNLKSDPETRSGLHLTEDSADALALALCHLNTIKLRKAIQR